MLCVWTRNKSVPTLPVYWNEELLRMFAESERKVGNKIKKQIVPLYYLAKGYY